MIVDIVLPAVLGPTMHVSPDPRTNVVLVVHTGSCSESGHRSLMSDVTISVVPPDFRRMVERGLNVRKASSFDFRTRGRTYRLQVQTKSACRPVAPQSGSVRRAALTCHELEGLGLAFLVRHGGGLYRISAVLVQGRASMGRAVVGGGEVKDRCRWSD